MKHMYEIHVQHQSLQKLDPQKTLANENHWQRWIRRITCSIKHSAHQNKCMTNNMARQREQSQDKPAWEPLNTVWPTKLAASYWTIMTLWAKTLVNCTGGRRRDQGSEKQSAELHGRHTQTPTFWKSTWPTARGQGAEDNMTNALVNCTGSGRRDQGCNHRSGKPRIGTAFHWNVSYARAQHHTIWWFCLVSRFSVFHTLTCRYWLWWL